MNIFVTAEFDSVDIAELSAAKIRHISKVKNIEIKKNRYGSNSSDIDEGVLPITPLGSDLLTLGASFSSNYFPSALIPQPEQSAVNETILREEAFFKAEVEDQVTAQRVSALLTSSGGRQVRITDSKHPN